MTAYEYICANIGRTTRTRQSLSEKSNKLIGLPYPYTSPCIDGKFQELYYWDTYFTNKVFFCIGKPEQAVNNVRNLIWLLNVYGKVPNGNRTDFLGRSQPPFLGCMLQDVLALPNCPIGMDEAFAALEREYGFWQSRRAAANGLNRYGCDSDERELLQRKHVAGYKKRTGIVLSQTAETAENVLAECESGWDFSPRFSGKCTEYNPVDLNCLLYRNERLLSDWAEKLGLKEKSELYGSAAAARKRAIGSLMLSDGVYYDYRFTTDSRSEVVSCAALFPFFVGIDEDIGRFRKILDRLEERYGLIACRFQDSRFQWSAPNSWAPLNYIAFAAALRLGQQETAERLADKYMTAVERLFARTGQLWEKYNATDGELDSESEYGTPAMLGWSAGVYAEFYRYRNKLTGG